MFASLVCKKGLQIMTSCKAKAGHRQFASAFAALQFALLLPNEASASEPLEKQIVRRIITDTDTYVMGGGQVRRISPPEDMIKTLLSLSSVVNLSVKASNVKFDPAAIQLIAESDEVKYERHVNCTTQVQPYKKEVNVSVVVGQSVTVSKGRTSTSNISVDLTVPFGADGSVSGSKGRTIQVNLSTETTKTNTRTDTETITIERSVQPYTALWVQAKRKKNTITVPFTADFIVDGNVIIQAYKQGGFSVKHHSYKISDKLPKDADRSFIGVGSVENVSAESIDIQLVEQKIDRTDPKACPPIPGLRPPS